MAHCEDQPANAEPMGFEPGLRPPGEIYAAGARRWPLEKILESHNADAPMHTVGREGEAPNPLWRNSFMF